MEPDPAKVGESGAPEKPDKQSDPWGIKRAENLIGSLQGVLSARVVATGSGEIKEIHVFTRGGTAAKQVVRNVESALLAHLGLAVDHRKISVAQTDEVSPMEVLEEEAVRLRASRRQLVFQKLEVTTLERQRVRFGVRLVLGDVDVVNDLEAADTPRARLQAAARVTVGAVDKGLPRGTVDLEGVRIIDAFDSKFAFVAVHIVDGRESRMATGSCEVTEGEERAAALAVLDATNRWVHSLL